MIWDILLGLVLSAIVIWQLIQHIMLKDQKTKIQLMDFYIEGLRFKIEESKSDEKLKSEEMRDKYLSNEITDKEYADYILNSPDGDRTRRELVERELKRVEQRKEI